MAGSALGKTVQSRQIGWALRLSATNSDTHPKSWIIGLAERNSTAARVACMGVGPPEPRLPPSLPPSGLCYRAANSPVHFRTSWAPPSDLFVRHARAIFWHTRASPWDRRLLRMLRMATDSKPVRTFRAQARFASFSKRGRASKPFVSGSLLMR